MHQIRRAEFAEGLEAVGSHVDNGVGVILVESVSLLSFEALPPDNNRNLSSEELTRALLSQPLLHTIAWKRADQDRGIRVSWC